MEHRKYRLGQGPSVSIGPLAIPLDCIYKAVQNTIFMSRDNTVLIMDRLSMGGLSVHPQQPSPETDQIWSSGLKTVPCKEYEP